MDRAFSGTSWIWIFLPTLAFAQTPNWQGKAAAGGVAATQSGRDVVLPNEHGQVWRRYDIRGYTSRVNGTDKPQQAIVDWILRETGRDVWFSEPLGFLSASRNTIRVYHTPAMQDTVSKIVERFRPQQGRAVCDGIATDNGWQPQLADSSHHVNATNQRAIGRC